VEPFARTHCNARPELVTDRGAEVSIVRHDLGCATLEAQVRARWPFEPATLPETPGQIPFASRAAFGRWHKAVLAGERYRTAG
jgi:hypothetical protein